MGDGLYLFVSEKLILFSKTICFYFIQYLFMHNYGSGWKVYRGWVGKSNCCYHSALLVALLAELIKIPSKYIWTDLNN